MNNDANQFEDGNRAFDNFELSLKSCEPALDSSFASITLYEAGYRAGASGEASPQNARMLMGFVGGIAATLLVTIFLMQPSVPTDETLVQVPDKHSKVDPSTQVPHFESSIASIGSQSRIEDLSSLVDHALADRGQLPVFASVESSVSAVVPPTPQPILNYGQIIQGLNSGEVSLLN